MLEEQKLKAEQLYIKYWHLMCHVAMEILQNSADAEDAVQQAFLYLMLHMDKLGDIDSPSTKAYVSLTAKHRVIDPYRSRLRCEPADISGMRTAGIHPEQLGVAEAISQLPARDRDMLLLRFWESYTTEEIAGMLHMKTDAVQKAIGGQKRSSPSHWRRAESEKNAIFGE